MQDDISEVSLPTSTQRTWVRGCKRCGNSFTSKRFRQDYCSTGCRFPEQTCPICCTKFATRNFRVQITCSKRCATSVRDMADVRACRINNFAGIRERADCTECGQAYKPTSARQKRCQTCVPHREAAKRLNLYGITEPQWQAMRARYDGKCWICQKRPGDNVDHCHKTGKVRGALCRACNMALHFVERPDWWADAQAYLGR